MYANLLLGLTMENIKTISLNELWDEIKKLNDNEYVSVNAEISNNGSIKLSAYLSGKEDKFFSGHSTPEDLIDEVKRYKLGLGVQIDINYRQNG